MNRFVFAPSLRFKITTGVTLVMIVVVALYTYLHYESDRTMVMRDAGNSLTNTSQLIKASLQHAMLQQDFGDLQSIMDNVGNESGIQALMLLNRDSVIRFAPNHARVGTQMDLSDPGCQACHQPGRPADQQNIIFTNSQGQRVLRNCNPIANQQACYQCHDASIRLNGVLITDFSLAETDNRLAQDLRDSILLGGGAVALLVLTVNLLMDRLVLARLGSVSGVLRRFGQGDLSQRLTLRSRDELGKLAETFNNMAASLQDKDQENARLYTELQQKEAARAQLLDKVIQAQEEERKRIARDLHDQLGATLSGLSMSIQAAEQSLPDQADGLHERWQRANNLAIEALEETHKLIFDLRPGVLDDLGLVAAIRSDAETHLQPRGIEVQIDVTGARRRLAPELELTLFRIAQEAIINIQRHARAEHVNVALEFLDSIVKVTIEDDGQGFDPQAVSTSEDKTRGLGLLGMSERASLAGGSLEIESTAGRGTRVVVTMPAPTDETAEKN